jgi:threonyl-tRNA synthetase
MLILGPKEADQKTVSVRSRESGDMGAMAWEALKQILTARNAPGSL